VTLTTLYRLIPLFERSRSRGEPTVLATVFRTAGSTYAKPGAQMLIAADGEYAGLLSGGCLEGDLREHAAQVCATGVPRVVSYDMRTPDDTLFGLGSGCEGAMDILLARCGPVENWQPLATMVAAYREARELRVAWIAESESAALPIGSFFVSAPLAGLPQSVDARLNDAMRTATTPTLIAAESPRVKLLVVPSQLSPALLLAGGGPDARPVAQLAEYLGWSVTVMDHRPAYARAAFFPASAKVIARPADELSSVISANRFDAAVVMSHHLGADLDYLRALAASAVPYVGLLGPAARREKLLGDLGADAIRLTGRLRAPVGLDIGGRAPESIALSIVGEIHAALAGRAGRPFSDTATS
jgi:xanthine/CO dehydrogenase XdhC/CoxF family maturation factor